MGRMFGDFGRGRILGSMSLAYRDKGVCKVMKRGKSNGAMLFGYVYKFFCYSEKRVEMGKGYVKGSTSVLRGTKVVVRRPNFLHR